MDSLYSTAYAILGIIFIWFISWRNKQGLLDKPSDRRPKKEKKELKKGKPFRILFWIFALFSISLWPEAIYAVVGALGRGTYSEYIGILSIAVIVPLIVYYFGIFRYRANAYKHEPNIVATIVLVILIIGYIAIPFTFAIQTDSLGTYKPETADRTGPVVVEEEPTPEERIEIIAEFLNRYAEAGEYERERMIKEETYGFDFSPAYIAYIVSIAEQYANSSPEERKLFLERGRERFALPEEEQNFLVELSFLEAKRTKLIEELNSFVEKYQTTENFVTYLETCIKIFGVYNEYIDTTNETLTLLSNEDMLFNMSKKIDISFMKETLNFDKENLQYFAEDINVILDDLEVFPIRYPEPQIKQGRATQKRIKDFLAELKEVQIPEGIKSEVAHKPQVKAYSRVITSQ